MTQQLLIDKKMNKELNYLFVYLIINTTFLLALLIYIIYDQSAIPQAENFPSIDLLNSLIQENQNLIKENKTIINQAQIQYQKDCLLFEDISTLLLNQNVVTSMLYGISVVIVTAGLSSICYSTVTSLLASFM